MGTGLPPESATKDKSLGGSPVHQNRQRFSGAGRAASSARARFEMSQTGVRGRWTRPVDQGAERLLRQCVAARLHGVDFPTVWTTILKPSRLTIGHPIQAFVDGHAVLKVRLTSNQSIICGPEGYSIG
jgi:hypothetical protein